MIDIFAYVDPLAFLRDSYEERHGEDPRFTYRCIGRKAGLPGTSLHNMMHGRARIRVDSIRRLCTAFGLRGEEAEYFGHLVRVRQSRRRTARRSSLVRLAEMYRRKVRTLSGGQHEYYAKWYYAAVRAFLALHRKESSFEEIGEAFDPPLSAAQVEEAVDVLMGLGLVKRNTRGTLSLTGASVSSGSSPEARAAVRDYNDTVMTRAQQVLEMPPAEEQDFSTLTVSVSEETAGALMEELRLLRERIVGMVQFDAGADRVFQLNMQLFPVAWKEEPPRRAEPPKKKRVSPVTPPGRCPGLSSD